eukprot:scaffold262637_cov49-Attheya_sp.AAC.1
MVRNGNVKCSIFEGEARGEASGSLWKDKHGNATLNGVIGFGVEGGNTLGIFARSTIDHDVVCPTPGKYKTLFLAIHLNLRAKK